MTKGSYLWYLAACFCSVVPVLSQTHAKEYIRAAGRLVAIETPRLASSGGSKVGVFRNFSSWAEWFLDVNGNGVWNGEPTDRRSAFGVNNDEPVVGDWTGSGQLRIGVFRNGDWFVDINGDYAWSGADIDTFFAFGIPGDVPVIGDWTNNGRLRIGVYRPSQGMWFLDINGNNEWDAGVDVTATFGGLVGDRPVITGLSGATAARLGVARAVGNAKQWLIDSSNDRAWSGTPTDSVFNFGSSGDTPIAGDWANTGHLRMGVFRPNNGSWALDKNGDGVWNGTPTDSTFVFGSPGDKPVVGKW